jgi:hypothetical protein
MYLRARGGQPCGEIKFRQRRLAQTIALTENRSYLHIVRGLKRQFEILEMIEFSIQIGRTEWDLLPRTAGNLLNQSDRQERAILRTLPAGDPVREQYRCFAFVDARMFPVEHLAGLSAKEVIRTVRISPSNPEKVHGRRFRHFGAFFKESWRSPSSRAARWRGSIDRVHSSARALPGCDLFPETWCKV